MLKNNFIRIALLALLVNVTLFSSVAGSIDEIMTSYNVVWDSQSENSTSSMPVGGHSMGCNVWVEDGDLLFYAQRSGSFTENNEYHKLGRFRLKLTPNPFADGAEFKQELKLQEGYVQITGKSAEVTATVNLWLEATRPVIHLDVESDVTTQAVVAYENWRTTTTSIATTPDHGAAFGCFSWDSYPGKIYKYADQIELTNDAVTFFHRNDNDNLLISFMIEQQNLSDVKDDITDTQTNRTFGGIMKGEGFVAAGEETGKYIEADYKAWKIASEEAKLAHSVKIYTHVDQAETIEIWKEDLMELVNEEITDEVAKSTTETWWGDYWAKSWLTISTDSPSSNQTGWDMGRNYQLFRYMLGCNYYGDYPTKFNGGNFTFDANPVLKGMKNFACDDTPDWRAWGGGSFTGQNQRLLYWPMLKTGDFEGMIPQFDFYNRALSTAKARVKKYWDHDGCAFTEQMENFGLPIACAWGFESGGRARTSGTPMGEQYNAAVKHQYEIQLEMSFMILEYNRYAEVDITEYMEFIEQSVIFFDKHYRMREKARTGKELDDNDKLVIYPSTACESHKMATNPIDVVAGIKACAQGLIDLPTALVSDEKKTYYQDVINSLPEFFTEETKKGAKYWRAAEKWESRVNQMELPEFYPLFPYNLHNLEDSATMEIYKNTYEYGNFQKNSYVSWHQDGIFLARMGMVNEAKNINTQKLKNGPFRFPSFWGPGHDWVPDHNWGGSGMIGIQEMLMQTTGDKIHLFPAWPKAWDVNFKFHAPGNTTVECTLKDGEVTELIVTPVSRKDDVMIMFPTPRVETGFITGVMCNDASYSGSWSKQEDFDAEIAMYGDRTYKMTVVPEYLKGNEWIRTACDSKVWTGETLATFNIAEEADVYIAHNNEIPSIPTWLKDYTNTGDSIETAFDENFTLFKKTFPKGSVSIGPNADNGTQRGCYIVIVVPTKAAGIGETTIKTDIVVYPNPAEDFITVKSDDVKSITLFDTKGQCVMTEAKYNGQTIDISSLTSGVYFAKMTSNDNTVSLQQIIKK